ncbi:MAG: hypothetical protein A2X80_13105 [Geobacteraceae bacterium GWB2_52_12]|nr:MAG: hypothetical protein A2X80_13105 [Geobacteraceae bacterium GWB2_52_12]
MKSATILLLLPMCLALAGGTACADYVVVKYRSGKIQTIPLEEPSTQITSISYQEDSTSAAEPSSPSVRGSAVATADEGATTEQKAGTPKANNSVRIKWAQPLE